MFACWHSNLYRWRPKIRINEAWRIKLGILVSDKILIFSLLVCCFYLKGPALKCNYINNCIFFFVNIPIWIFDALKGFVYVSWTRLYFQNVRVQRLVKTAPARVNAILQKQSPVTKSLVRVSVSLVGRVLTVIRMSRNALRILPYVLLIIPNVMRCRGPISASAKQGMWRINLVCAKVSENELLLFTTPDHSNRPSLLYI